MGNVPLRSPAGPSQENWLIEAEDKRCWQSLKWKRTNLAKIGVQFECKHLVVLEQGALVDQLQQLDGLQLMSSSRVYK